MTMAYRAWTAAAALSLALALPISATGQTPATGTLRGVVVDARDGTPLEKVAVRIADSKLTTITASDGRFQLDNVPSGRREIYVSAVDFVLIRRSIEVPAGDVLEMTIPITAGTGHLYGDGQRELLRRSERSHGRWRAGAPKQRASAAPWRHHE